MAVVISVEGSRGVLLVKLWLDVRTLHYVSGLYLGSSSPSARLQENISW
jgi:hypothetical protein